MDKNRLIQTKVQTNIQNRIKNPCGVMHSGKELINYCCHKWAVCRNITPLKQAGSKFKLYSVKWELYEKREITDLNKHWSNDKPVLFRLCLLLQNIKYNCRYSSEVFLWVWIIHFYNDVLAVTDLTYEFKNDSSLILDFDF